MNTKINYLEKSILENMKLKLNVLKENGLKESIFEHAEKAVDEALNGDNRHSAIAAGLMVEHLLYMIYEEKGKNIQDCKNKEVSWICGQINQISGNKVFDENIISIFSLIYKYRNQGSHANSDKIIMDESMFILKGVFIILTWYMEDVKQVNVDFSKIDISEKIEEYIEFWKMACVDGELHEKEITILN